MGKWSKAAREKHSVRMKERFKAKQEKAVWSPLTINQRLELIEQQVAAIRKQLGG